MRDVADIQAGAGLRRELGLVAPANERDRTMLVLVAAAAVGLLVLPFVVTFNEFITKGVQAIGGDAFLAEWIVPYESRAAAAVLALLHIPVTVGPGTIILGSADAPTVLRISWNCVGWQSLVLFGLTCVTGLQGEYPRRAKLAVLAIGIAGIVAMNVVRIALVGAIAWWLGTIPAIVAHDYGTVIASIVFLMAFWALAYNHVLEPSLAEGAA